jgi:hypothetical protein
LFANLQCISDPQGNAELVFVHFAQK